MDRNVKVILDGKEVYGYGGQKILDLCGECGGEIPTLCYDPHLSVHGGCSVCLVDVKGAKALVRACASTIAPGMIIQTNTERVRKARKLALELLFSDHVGDCRPPCTLACPAHGDVQGYINLAAQGKYEESLEALHKNITLPASIGRVCPAPCEEKCRRNFVDEQPVSIREIKRFVGDWCLKNDALSRIPEIVENHRRVAIVGGGPAGVSAAYFLRKMGYGVTLFDKESDLGGMMRYGIPDYRLPREILTREIQWITDHGIEVRTETALGRDISLDQLRDEYDAVLLAMGCWKSSPMRVPGEDLPGVFGGIDFLYKVNNSLPTGIGSRVAVVGGGNTAMDACRCAKRLGAERVMVVYRRTREEMPAQDIEIHEAMEEGVEFHFLMAPKAVIGNGRVEALECERMVLGEPDASGRRKPLPTGEIVRIEVDTVIAAIGQQIRFDGIPKALHDGKQMIVDENYATPLPGVFVCGDQQTGPDIAVRAIGNGHYAAMSIHSYITTGKPKKPFEYDVVRTDLGPADFTHIEKQPQEEVAHVDPQLRVQMGFKEYSGGLTEEQTLRDAKRCMECGCQDLHECRLRRYGQDYEVQPERVAGEHIPRVVEANAFYDRNMDKCILCGRCVRTCDEIAGFHAIDFTKRGFEGLIDTEFWKPIDESECTSCGLCVQMCPVGALTEKKAPRWPHSEKPVLVPTACSECPVGCDIVLNLDKGSSRLVRVTTDLDNAASPTMGNSCRLARALPLSTTENRLGSPMLRVNGRLFETDWDQALEHLSSKLKAAVESQGVESVLLLAGGNLSNEEATALGKLSADGLGGAPIHFAGLDCGTAAWNTLKTRWGTEWKPEDYGDLNASDALLLLDADTDNRQPVLTSFIRKAMRQRHAQVVAIGRIPKKLERGEALILSPIAGTEEHLVRGLLAASLNQKGIVLPEALTDYTPAKVEALTGIPAETIEKAARVLTNAKSLSTLWGGVFAADPRLASETTALLDQLKQRKGLILHEAANAVGLISLGFSSAGVSQIQQSVRSGKVKALVLAGTSPEAFGLTAADLRTLDLFASFTTKPTELEAEEAEVLLPVAAWTEREGSFNGLTGQLHVQPLGAKPYGNSRSLVRILSHLSRKMGANLPAVESALRS
ncbi:MAG: FAD-dependent oxidoreductase [Synergistaceae bacterium]|nr:FAD-dependent oxidoreductase [Synergistaceae bacterium]